MREPTRFRQKLSHLTRRTSRSIGHGKSSKRKKIVKNLLRISRSKRKLASPSSSKKMSSSRASWSNSETKMRSTLSLE